MMSVPRNIVFSNIHVARTPCRRCLLLGDGTPRRRSLSSQPPPRETGASNNEPTSDGTKEQGALSRRLSEMTDEALMEGGRSARKNIEAASFSEELKSQLEEKIKMSTFKSEHAGAFAVANLPASAGKGTQDIAGATPWRETESIQDTALRMLDDSKKPMRVPYQIPKPTSLPVVNLKPAPKTRESTGHRLASARDRTTTYTLSQSAGLSEEEREAMRKELRARFEPGARSLPMSIQGLTSLANERIEDAIARGQFKNLPRGKGQHTQTDHNANSAFIDTTEYFMNKIIQKQEIVPPWIEKQQELAREVDRFRQRLRVNWRRHAARLISSKGGTLQEQQARARGYALAEARLNEKKLVDASFASPQTTEPSFSQITHDGQLAAAAQSSTQSLNQNNGGSISSSGRAEPSTGDDANASLPQLPPLRDPEFMATERGWHELQIKTINDMTRSYNLQAPRLAQKPYLNLERELKTCYADVAPTLADELSSRATGKARASPTTATSRKSSGGVLGDIVQSHQRVRVYDEDSSKGYGLKEFWRDLWGKGT